MHVLRHEGGPESGGAVQGFHPAGSLEVAVEDLSGLDPAAREARVAALAAAPIDPLEAVFRATLVDLGPQAGAGPQADGGARHLLLLGLHHMAHDGVSIEVLMAEFARLWQAGGVDDLPPPALHYADFAVWQRAALAGGSLAPALAQQVAALQGAPTVLDLPADRPRPDEPGHAGAQATVHLPADLTRALRDLARAEGASLYMVLEAGLAALLSRLARAEDLVIGTVLAGRGDAALERMIGPFFNMAAIRHRIAPGTPFRAVLREARAAALGVLDAQMLPFEALLRDLAPTRDPRRAFSPLFQVLFQLHTETRATGAAHVDLDGLRLTLRPAAAGAAYHDLTFDLFEMPDGAVQGRLTYAAELFDAPRSTR